MGPTTTPGPDGGTVARHLEQIDERGYTIVPDAVDAELLDALDEALTRIESERGVVPAGNSFEGRHTVRVYNLLARDAVFARVPVHPAVLSIVDGVLDRGCLVSSLSSIGIEPGETAQPIHADDQLMPIAKPHPPTVCNSMWALTEFTEANGATRVVPGSHRADTSPDYGHPYDSVPAEMERGSVLIWHGSLWHGGGANTTDRRRTGIAMNYCAGYIRPQENQQLGIPLERLLSFEPRLQELCGLDVYMGLIGHIDRRRPVDVLTASPAPSSMLWDRA